MSTQDLAAAQAHIAQLEARIAELTKPARMTINNVTGYAYNPDLTPNDRTRHTLEVTFITDMVRGAWHDPVDLMKWIASHSYVDTVSLKEDLS